eukprot:m.25033 g.25033  ORF g.25033 m.25033 type:complete len:64 (-) comp9162_c0_seq1:1518-1709(-)
MAQPPLVQCYIVFGLFTSNNKQNLTKQSIELIKCESLFSVVFLLLLFFRLGDIIINVEVLEVL